MTDDPDPGDLGEDGAPRHVDAISEVEAEAEAEATAAARVEAGDVFGTGPAANHRIGRQRFLVLYLRIALALAFVVGVVELLVPEERRDDAGSVMVLVFVVVPLGRVVWLVLRWARRGDWRFAAVGAVLLAVVATGLLAG